MDDVGPSGMNFVVREQTNASSIPLPAPSDNLSTLLSGNPPEMSFADFLRAVDGKKQDEEQTNVNSDYILSSTDSSEED